MVTLEHATSGNVSLSVLNDDCIRLIVDKLRLIVIRDDRWDTAHSLKHFSVVARRYRQLAVPILFSRCRVSLYHPKRLFIPENLWSYVRKITFFGEFYPYDFYGKYPAEEYLISVMPRLTSLEVVRFVGSDGGVPSYFFEAMILAPRLRAIHVEDHTHWPVSDRAWSMCGGDLPEDTPVVPLHMQEFTWTRHIWRDVGSYYFPKEMVFFSSFIPRMRPTLRRLHLTAESFCHRELCSYPWPSLVELSITGQHPLQSTIGLDFSPLFNNIPSLQTFNLSTPQSADSSRIVLLQPTNTSSHIGLTSLQSVSISFPDPDDAIFGFLSRSLRHLSLTDWPRHYLRVDENDCVLRRGWTSPILTSRELLDIVRRCHFPELESLEVVYQADPGDTVDILLDIAQAFSALRTLKLFRYRSSSSDPVHEKSIIRCLSHLKELRKLYIHIDMDGARVPPPWETEEIERADWFRETQGDRVRMLAEGLTHELEEIYMLERRGGSRTLWAAWEIRREVGEKRIETICTRVRDRDIPEQDDGSRW